MGSITLALSPEDIEAIAASVAAKIAPPRKQRPEAEELLDEQQLSEETGISVRTLQMWRHRKTGPRFIKLGRAVRYARIDLELWQRAGRKS